MTFDEKIFGFQNNTGNDDYERRTNAEPRKTSNEPDMQSVFRKVEDLAGRDICGKRKTWWLISGR